VWHPDLTLPHYNSLIVEYAGMPDVAEYAEGIQHKQNVYRTNGIPALFVYPQDPTGPAWPDRLHKTIEAAGEQAMRRYRHLPGETAGRLYS
jgi:hypothetical protein